MIQWIGLAISAIGLISDYVGNKRGADAAEDQAALQATHEDQLTNERLRQIDKEERALYGETLARYAGSGVKIFEGDGSRGLALRGSVGQNIEEQRREFAYEKQITRQVGATKVSQALMQGKAVSDQYKYGAYSGALKGAGNLMQQYYMLKNP